MSDYSYNEDCSVDEIRQELENWEIEGKYKNINKDNEKNSSRFDYSQMFIQRGSVFSVDYNNGDVCFNDNKNDNNVIKTDSVGINNLKRAEEEFRNSDNLNDISENNICEKDDIKTDGYCLGVINKSQNNNNIERKHEHNNERYYNFQKIISGDNKKIHLESYNKKKKERTESSVISCRVVEENIIASKMGTSVSNCYHKQSDDSSINKKKGNETDEREDGDRNENKENIEDVFANKGDIQVEVNNRGNNDKQYNDVVINVESGDNVEIICSAESDNENMCSSTIEESNEEKKADITNDDKAEEMKNGNKQIKEAGNAIGIQGLDDINKSVNKQSDDKYDNGITESSDLTNKKENDDISRNEIENIKDNQGMNENIQRNENKRQSDNNEDKDNTDDIDNDTSKDREEKSYEDPFSDSGICYYKSKSLKKDQVTMNRKDKVRVDESEPSWQEEVPFERRDVVLRKDKWVTDLYAVDSVLGRGKFGEVKKCRERRTGRQLAAKFIEVSGPQDRTDVINEVEIMKHLQHPRLLQLYDAFEHRDRFCLVLELVSGGELFERVINEDFILTEKACVMFMRQICDGVTFMHSENILHLDMKPENILCLTREGNRIKIIDFGLARKYTPKDDLRVLFGTPEFVAPEVVNFDPIYPSTDMWSVGVICYVLLSGLSPFMGDTEPETLSNVTMAKWDFKAEEFDNISAEAKDFISKLLVKDPRKRMSAADCLEHQWLRRSVKRENRLPERSLSKKRLRKFVYRRKWQKAINAMLALRRMGVSLC